MNRQIGRLFLVMVLVATCRVPIAYAQQPPPLPQAFFGTVEVNGQLAPVGVQIEARGADVKTGILGNPLVTTVAGRYGGPTLSEPKLGVQGRIEDGARIEFYIDGVKAECARPGDTWQGSYPFTSGVVTELNLRTGQSTTPTATQQSAATLTVTPPGTLPPTITPTATLPAGATQHEDSPAPTATRQTPQPGRGGTLPQPTAGSGTPTPEPPLLTTQPADLQKALITRPTQPASLATTPLQSPSPVVSSESALPMPASPTPMPVAQSTAPSASATPAAIAKASAATPRPTSKPIISNEIHASTQSSPDQSVTEPNTASSGGLLAPLGGIVLLALAGVVGVSIVLRRRFG
jgi:hypothetical protein